MQLPCCYSLCNMDDENNINPIFSDYSPIGELQQEVRNPATLMTIEF